MRKEAPVLVPVAHGSRDPRSAATIAQLVAAVRRRGAGVEVRPAFLDFDLPRLDDVLSALDRPAVVVPLLLGSAFHAKVDVPAVVAAARDRSPRARITIADVLGPDPRLLDVVAARLGELGLAPGDPGLGIVLAGTGSSHASANAAVQALARRWPNTRAAFATVPPSVADAAAQLTALGAERIAVAPWFLAPGRLLDRVRAAAPGLVAAPLGDHPAVADTVLARYASAQGRHPTTARHVAV